MGAIEGEEGVLKLVHPGRYVEIHKEPITAADVLKKNPRHSVTRPDVFECPWIVVRPESVLNLGRVFYIVPNRTIYKLIKAKGFSIQPSLQQNQPPGKSYLHRQLLEQTSPSKSSAGGTPEHHDHCQSHWQQFQATSWDEKSPREQAGDERFNRSSQFESLADVMTKYQSTHKDFKEISVTDSISDIESVDYKEYHFSEASSGEAAALKQDNARVAILKPCLKKCVCPRKLLHRKVSFHLPTNCKEQKRKVTESRAESPGFFTC